MMLKYVISFFLTACISYLLGSCNSAIITVRLMKHVDIRDYGSKNAGLTNTLRCFGKGCALFTLIGDLLKGVLAVFISRGIFRFFDIGFGADNDTRFVGYIAGIFAVIGHIFPVFYNFKGGKGILVSAAVLLAVDPISFCIVIPFFAVVLAITKYVSVASISSAVVYPIVTFATQYLRSTYTTEQAVLHTCLVVVTSIMLIYMHRTNIKRLKEGTENKFSFKSRKE
ncbi:MAG: glycerol-3-phosphate 1-O-acyltransferase PlsY [Oscillospiraceae bacterium]